MSAKYKFYHFTFKRDGKIKHFFEQYKVRNEEELLTQFHNNVGDADEVKYELSSIADLENFLKEQVRKEKEYLDAHPEILAKRRAEAKRSELRLQRTFVELAGICASFSEHYYDYMDMSLGGPSGKKDRPLPRTVVGENIGKILGEFEIKEKELPLEIQVSKSDIEKKSGEVYWDDDDSVLDAIDDYLRETYGNDFSGFTYDIDGDIISISVEEWYDEDDPSYLN